MENKNLTKFKDEMLTCIRCGYCFADCPTFTQLMWDSNSARGRIMLSYGLMTGEVDINDKLVERLYECTLCGQCETKCSAGVEILDIIKATRKDLGEKEQIPEAHQGLKQVFTDKENIYGEEQYIPREVEQDSEYIFFGGCVGNFREEESLNRTVELLNKLNVNFTRIPEVCCGGVFEDLGLEPPEKLAAQNIENIKKTGIKKIIFSCPKCFMTFTGDPRYKALEEQGYEMLNIVQFLQDRDLGLTTDKVVTYHDPCDLGRHNNIYEEPREIIKKVAPNFKEFTKNRDQSHCCGSGGGVRGAYTKMSIKIAKRRFQEALDIDADILLTECPSCLHNFRNAKKRRHKMEVKNISEFLCDLIEEKEK